MLPRMLDRIFEEYDLSMEEFAKDPYGFIDKLEDEYLKGRIMDGNGTNGLI